jgi:HSP20 family molecular chaperone IbpA
MKLADIFKGVIDLTPKKEVFVPAKHSHTSGKKTYIFNLPGISPVNIKISNKERKILIVLVPENRVFGYISTYDQIDKSEINAKYQYGQVVVTIEPDENKNKPYDIDLKQ